MAKTSIKHGTGSSDIRSPVYASLGSLKSKPTGLARVKPIRGQKQRSKGR